MLQAGLQSSVCVKCWVRVILFILQLNYCLLFLFRPMKHDTLKRLHVYVVRFAVWPLFRLSWPTD